MAHLKPKVLCKGKYLQMVQAGHWEYVERPDIPGAVAILAVTDREELVLIEQHRIPLAAHVVELPAGLAGDVAGEHDLAETARRELLEETGFQAEKMTLLAVGATSAGLTNEEVSLFRAESLTKVGPGGGDAHERITVHLVPLAKVDDWLGQQRGAGKHIDIKIYAALRFAQQPE